MLGHLVSGPAHREIVRSPTKLSWVTRERILKIALNRRMQVFGCMSIVENSFLNLRTFKESFHLDI